MYRGANQVAFTQFFVLAYVAVAGAITTVGWQDTAGQDTAEWVIGKAI
ncbi:MAG TPA: hypothetical protein VFT16_00185 [Candidatus Saccharimonadales bacterium]|nr:hypothetical protein [Candidatus Saccharimonadales bacterium]